MFDALARLADRRRRAIVAAALAFFVAGGVLGTQAFDVLQPFGFEDPQSESVEARESLARAAGYEPNPQLVAVVEPGGRARSRRGRRAVAAVARTMRADPGVAGVVTAFDRAPSGIGPEMVSTDGRATYVLGFYRAGLGDDEKDEAAQRLGERLEGRPGVTLGGFGAALNQIGTTVEEDLERAELLAFPILFVLSFWIFRSLVAAALPLLVGGLSIVGALAGLRLGSEVTDLSVFAVNLVTGLGLGLAIDYSLFVVTRYREEMARLGPGAEALRETMRTAGRTVVFSALTVAAALAALLVFPQQFLYSIGFGGVLVALLSALVAVTVLPAVLALLGERVNAGAPAWLQRAASDTARPATAGLWYRLSRFVMRRPIPIATIAAAAMLLLGLPFLKVDFVFADAGNLPSGASARQVDDALESRFPRGRTTPIILELRARGQGRVTADSAGRAAASRDEAGRRGGGARPLPRRRVAAFARRLRALPGVDRVTPPVRAGPATVRMDIFSSGAEYSDTSQDLVRQIRALDAPFEVRVAGTTAEFVDQKQSLADHLPLGLAIVAAATFLVLFVLTGSVVLPVKSLIMNLLTVSAAFGILVLVFQDGRLESLLGYRSEGALESSMPIVLFAIAFGLSTDYGVFLLTRIKEARDAGAGETEAVAVGLERTGRIVTAAAVLFCVAVGAFLTSRMINIKEFSLGTVAAVLVDATIVRAFLVPSLMRLLGRWNWWAPPPLRRLYERIGLSEA